MRAKRGTPGRPAGRLLALLAAAGLAVAVVLPFLHPPGSGHTTYYVSRGGDGSSGRSWQHAWNELGQIRWNLVQPGDLVMIDGGSLACPSNAAEAGLDSAEALHPCGMTYRTSLVVASSGRLGAPVTIALSTERGRDGTVVLQGGRTTALPFCNQRTYRQSGTELPAGIAIRGRTHVVIDGRHRSGIVVRGARAGVDLLSDRTSFVTLRNLEISDNGTAERWPTGWRSDGEGVSLAGHDITLERSLIHDNGQDEVQDRSTGVPGIGHLPLHDIVIKDSWLYNQRENPLYPGYGFNSGAQALPAQDCTHVDGVQIWGGGLHQERFTVLGTIFGPLIAQGFYPGDRDRASFDDVTLTDVLFLDPSEHGVNGDSIASDGTTPSGWKIDRVTSYLSPRPLAGTRSHGSIDLAGSGHSVTRSIFVNGYFAMPAAFRTATGNLFWGGDPVPGGARADPRFVGPEPGTGPASFVALTTMVLQPRCAPCLGRGATLVGVASLLARIDRLDAYAGPEVAAAH
ncbi:MAG: hypothetical protein QOF39_1755 [Frankiales bacterium]|jgi:hypothetical protein|nr:hypothetical protein [Frankiales bacterium]